MPSPSLMAFSFPLGNGIWLGCHWVCVCPPGCWYISKNMPVSVLKCLPWGGPARRIVACSHDPCMSLVSVSMCTPGGVSRMRWGAQEPNLAPLEHSFLLITINWSSLSLGGRRGEYSNEIKGTINARRCLSLVQPPGPRNSGALRN